MHQFLGQKKVVDLAIDFALQTYSTSNDTTVVPIYRYVQKYFLEFDIGPDGFDFDSGNGLVDAFAAVTSVLTEKQTTSPTASPTASPPTGYDICSWLGFSFTCRIP